MQAVLISFHFKVGFIQMEAKGWDDAEQTTRRIWSASLINKLLLMKEIINFCLPLDSILEKITKLFGSVLFRYYKDLDGKDIFMLCWWCSQTLNGSDNNLKHVLYKKLLETFNLVFIHKANAQKSKRNPIVKTCK